MTLNKRNFSIGGYFELELRHGRELHSGAVPLNTARNAFEYILRAQLPNKIFIPKYTCDVILEPLKKLNIVYDFYSINDKFEIVSMPTLGAKEMILYTNYFGIKDSYCNQVSEIYGNQIIIDCSQAFYYVPPEITHAIYSPRKFFGVADGGYAKTNKKLDQEFEQDYSYERMSHLLKRVDCGPEFGFEDYKSNDSGLIGQPIKEMSELTRRILESVDYEYSRAARSNNFMLLHGLIGESNSIEISADDICVPMVYPYLVKDGYIIRKLLQENKIYTATYWPNVIEWCDDKDYEYYLAKNLISLPIDQRYGSDEIAIIAGYLK